MPDKRGKPKKTVNEEAYELIEPVVAERVEFEREDIIARMMLPMATEMARCVEEGIVGTPPRPTWPCFTASASRPSAAACSAGWTPWAWRTSPRQSEKFAHLGKPTS